MTKITQENADIIFRRTNAIDDPNEYQITSLQDIRNCVNEDNVDGFLEDFKLMILTWQIEPSISTNWLWIDDKPRQDR